MSRLDPGFHQTFKFERSRTVEVVQFVAARQGSGSSDVGVTQKRIEGEAVELGTNLRKAFPRYAIGMGLLRSAKAGYQLSRFGETVLAHDVTLSHLTTQWLLHAHMAGVSGPGPLFWHLAFAQVVRPGSIFADSSIEMVITEAQERLNRDPISPTSTKKSVAAFRNSYLPGGGLDILDLFQPLAGDRERFVVNYDPIPPNPRTFGAALINDWLRSRPGQLTMPLDDFQAPGGLAELLFLDRPKMDHALDILQRDGLIAVFRTAPPVQLVRRWSDAEADSVMADALQRMYAPA